MATPRFKERYLNEVVPALQREFQYANPMQVPRLMKVVLNIGLGEALSNARALEGASGDMTAIAGQHPVITRAKKSIAQFRVREGQAIGMMVTLRQQRMWDFTDRLISTALPRIRDFRGISAKSFDGRGNFSMGVSEQIIFPEIDYDKIDALRGMDISIATTAKTDDEARALLRAFNFPFRG